MKGEVKPLASPRDRGEADTFLSFMQRGHGPKLQASVVRALGSGDPVPSTALYTDRGKTAGGM